jgi:general secretion pathway protein D
MKNRPVFALITCLLLAATASAQPATDTQSTNILDLIDRLAGDIDKEIIVDPRLSPDMSVFTTEAEPDYESLLGVLRLYGYVALETADQILIVPEQNARSNPSRILQEDDRNVSDHEIVTRIISLPDMPDRRTAAQIEAQTAANPFSSGGGELAPQFVPVLRPMMPQSASLAAIPNMNKLVIVDRYDNVRRITAVIDEIIKDLEN